MEGQAGKPDLESRRQKIMQMHEEKRRQRRAAKQARKHRRQEDAEARWHAKMVEKKKARLAQGLGSDDAGAAFREELQALKDQLEAAKAENAQLKTPIVQTLEGGHIVPTPV